MKAKKPAELSDEELLKQAKTAKVVTHLFFGAVAVLVALSIFNTVKSGFSAITMMPFGFLPLVIITAGNLGNLQKEIKARGLK